MAFGSHHTLITPLVEGPDYHIYQGPAMTDEIWSDITKKADEVTKPLIIVDCKCDFQDIVPDHIDWKPHNTILWLNMTDHKSHSMRNVEWLHMTAQTIAQYAKNGYMIHTHCMSGINRATTINASLLMLLQRKKWHEALDYIGERRPDISPFSFHVDLLRQLEKRL